MAYPGTFLPSEPVKGASAPLPAARISPRFVLGAMLTRQAPLTTFLADQNIAAATDITIDVQNLMNNRCTGFILLNIVGTVQISINGGGLRTVPSAMVINDADVSQLRIITAALSTCTVQLHGV